MKSILFLSLLIICISSYSQVSPQVSSTVGNLGSIEQRAWCDTLLTTGLTPTTYFSIPVSQNKDMTLKLNVRCRKIDYSGKTGGSISAEFSRGTGNLMQQGSPIVNMVTGFVGQKPTVLVIANTSTQSIDVIVSGISATNLIWSANYYLTYNP